MWGAGDVINNNVMSNILKPDAAQMNLLPAQSSTNEAQTNEAILGEFRSCGGQSDLR